MRLVYQLVPWNSNCGCSSRESKEAQQRLHLEVIESYLAHPKVLSPCFCTYHQFGMTISYLNFPKDWQRSKVGQSMLSNMKADK